MTRQTGGTRRSSWHTFRRRLLLVRLLLRQPMTKDNLIAAVQNELGDEGYPAAAASALKHDFDALKSEYECRIVFQRATSCYVLEDLGSLALLELPDECMEALAFLDASFPAGMPLPEHANIRDLLERVIRLLPTLRQEEHFQRRSSMVLDMAGRAPNRINQGVLNRIRRAINNRQEISFDYLSLFDEGEPRTHRVAPYLVFFRPEGHGYLDATVMEVTPDGSEQKHAAIHYRLDRIISGSVKILPNMLPPERIQPPAYHLCYKLLPIVARRQDVASYFPNTQMTYHDDGSATVTATVTNLWQARQILLRYGNACEVLDPPELIELFRETAHGMAEIYGPYTADNQHQDASEEPYQEQGEEYDASEEPYQEQTDNESGED
jgi:predicted DNA-binding transcriptional regulator YafY